MKKTLTFISFVSLFFMVRTVILSHCEVPCGIYNDEMRFAMIEEHIQTIEKAMIQAMELSKESPQNMNQIVRWIMNKETHAEEIQHIVSQYFLTQRIKSDEQEDSEAIKSYHEKLVLCHQLLVYSMKAKQTTDLSVIEKLRSALQLFKKAYFEEKK